MARLLALEWDAREARVVVGRARGRELTLEHAFAVELTPREAGRSAGTNVGERIGAALSARGLGSGEALVSVGRTNIELRVLTLPPSPEDELPDMVRFQAMRQFSTLGDDWAIDFAKLQEDEDASLSILAAAISPDVVRQIQATCAEAQLTTERLALRPFAAASLLARARPGMQCRLMVDVLTDEADLTVMIDQRVVFLRTVRLSADVHQAPEKMALSLIPEIRRTMVAAQNQLGGHPLDEIVMCGEEDEHEELVSRIHEALNLPVQVFDPFELAVLAGELRDNRPDAPGRYAPLIGLLTDEALGVKPAIDFLHPRKRPENRGLFQRKVLIGSAIAAALLLCVGLFWWNARSTSNEIARLQEKSKNLDAMVQVAERKVSEVALIDRFKDADVTWLEKLSEISREFPPGEKAYTTQVRFVAGNTAGGQIHLNGFVDSAETVELLENALRDARHRVVGRGTSIDNKRSDYPWDFDETMIVEVGDEESPADQGAEPDRKTDADPDESPGDDRSEPDAEADDETPGPNEALEIDVENAAESDDGQDDQRDESSSDGSESEAEADAQDADAQDADAQDADAEDADAEDNDTDGQGEDR